MIRVGRNKKPLAAADFDGHRWRLGWQRHLLVFRWRTRCHPDSPQDSVYGKHNAVTVFLC